MNVENCIIVAVDFSPCSKAALVRALQIASWFEASVTAVHVVPPVTPPSRGPLGPLSPGFDLPSESDLLEAGRQRWEEFAGAVPGAQDVCFHVEVGDPRERIVDAVRREHPRLLVIGAHGRDDGYMGIGSVASACAQRAATEVLVVRENQTKPFRSVVACVDFNETSLAALGAAANIAAEERATLHILHVYTDPWAGLNPPERVQPSLAILRDRHGRLVEQRLREFCAGLAGRVEPLKPVFHAALARIHGEGITKFIAEHGCDLAVLGTRGKFNLRDYFWGSTADRVVREAKCSVLTVKPAGFVESDPYRPLADTAAVHESV